MTRELVVLTDFQGHFGQRLMPWESLDVDVLVSELSKQFRVRRVTYEQIANGEETVAASTIIHSSSQQPAYKEYVEDVLLFLMRQSNILVPSFNAVKAHENKGFQELYKRNCQIKCIAARYYCGEGVNTNDIRFPAVFKETSGFGSSGVHLVQNERDLARFQRAELRLTARELLRSIKSEFGYLVRKLILRRSNLRPWGSYYKPRKRYIVQEFIEGLQFDYKVIILRKRAFVLKRQARPDDFRASGSGRFSFEVPPDGLLNYAHRVLEQLDEPYASLDVLVRDQDFYLIEYQIVHFGPYTIIKAPFHFYHDRGAWQRSEEQLPLERLIAESLIDYLRPSVPSEWKTTS